ncbi:RNA 2',3'-cyclic phosphodiesterase [Halalkalibacillus halophilus]|uniref:RNA 2',3'-cyclic phosphodiesterase n=1 Tax=Halalkalibacillus halophilus TaxID=392827 RepID=UPI00040FD3F7|nr:RNA 2',3'-cyclic phosphodiesterase [Halalkalibacillus halophilus]
MADDAHYFIGVPIPSDRAKKLRHWQQAVKPFVHYKTWIHGEDFHITLKFLGSVSEEKLEEIKYFLGNISNFHSMLLEVDGIDFFGKEKQPRVMYGVVKEHHTLSNLKEFIERECEKIGFGRELRPYKPHITLAKKWEKKQLYISNGQLASKIKVDTNFTFEADSINIYQVHPEKIPKYEVVHTITLPS